MAGIIRVHHPTLTQEERGHRMEQIKQATIQFYMETREIFKAGIAFVVFLLSIALIDSEKYYILFAIIALVSLWYMKIVAGRIAR